MTTPYRTPQQPETKPMNPDALKEAALSAVLSALRDLDPDQCRAVLLAASQLRELGLYDTAAHDGEQLVLTITAAAALLHAASGAKP